MYKLMYKTDLLPSDVDMASFFLQTESDEPNGEGNWMKETRHAFPWILIQVKWNINYGNYGEIEWGELEEGMLA